MEFLKDKLLLCGNVKKVTKIDIKPVIEILLFYININIEYIQLCIRDEKLIAQNNNVFHKALLYKEASAFNLLNKSLCSLFNSIMKDFYNLVHFSANTLFS